MSRGGKLTSNTDSGVLHAPAQVLEVANKLLIQLEGLNAELVATADRGDWFTFRTLVDSRQLLLDEFTVAEQSFRSEKKAAAALKTPLLQQQLDTICDEIKKLTKVNGEIFDTITIKRDDLLQSISNANKGLTFLKRYGNQVNQERVVSKVY